MFIIIKVFRCLFEFPRKEYQFFLLELLDEHSFRQGVARVAGVNS
jgi:hypothetical protein